MMNVVDIKAIAQIGKAHNIIVAVDNTFASPYLQQPLQLGASIVLHLQQNTLQATVIQS